MYTTTAGDKRGIVARCARLAAQAVILSIWVLMLAASVLLFIVAVPFMAGYSIWARSRGSGQ